MSLEFNHKFSSGINVGVNQELFKQTFQKRIETGDILDLINIANNKSSRLIGINGSDHSAKVKIIDSEDIKDKVTILERGIDSLILINKVNIQKKNLLLLLVADCAPISFSNKSGITTGLLHAGYKGIALDILGNTIKELENLGENISELEFYVGPMAGDKFEFSESDYFMIFDDLARDYKLDLRKYFDIKAGPKKGYLDLRGIIKDVLLKRGLKNSNINFSDIETNNSENLWPSYRLHTIYKSLVKKQEFGEELSILEKDLLESGNMDVFKIDRRLAMFLEN